jgi:hypothetical protein
MDFLLPPILDVVFRGPCWQDFNARAQLIHSSVCYRRNSRIGSNPLRPEISGSEASD